jgi:hypothetical protein
LQTAAAVEATLNFVNPFVAGGDKEGPRVSTRVTPIDPDKYEARMPLTVPRKTEILW